MYPRAIVGCLLLGLAVLVQAANLPPVNPYLAEASYAMAHGNPAQQDAVPQPGPDGPTRRLGPEEIQYQHVGPAHFGAITSGVYPDGRRVFLWMAPSWRFSPALR
jgi:hypothetical protein